MDITMPVLDGKAATRDIKATARGARTPVIAVTYDDDGPLRLLPGGPRG